MTNETKRTAAVWAVRDVKVVGVGELCWGWLKLFFLIPWGRLDGGADGGR